MAKIKRFSSLLLAIIMAVSAIIIPGTSYAGDFESGLAKAGFTSSYITALSKLHEKYPNWNFVPLITNISLDEGVANERKKHSQQLIQKTNSNESKGYLCRCSDCYVNGAYVIREGKTWVSASESAVKYYMNPLSFLDEKYIFQFESTSYDSGQTTAGVETIIQNTWMYNSYITYKDAGGNTLTYTSAAYPSGVKYSQAILDAAKYSGLSAYYLASKIVQEVGGKSPTAAGASGTNSNYPGIYNYYNIGANTGAEDGLKWASSGASGFATNTDNVRLRSQPNTSSTILAKLPKNTSATLISTTEKQKDGYVWYYVQVYFNGQYKKGYIRSDLIGEQYGRPWTNPYRSIYNGAKYIANNFSSTQNTGYLQKFNVNPASSNRYNHEYMANVQAAASEASNTYKAYSKANLLSAVKTFYIPVYTGLDSGISGFTVTGRGDGGKALWLDWNDVLGAAKYEVYDVTNGAKTLKGTATASEFKFTDLTPAWEYDIKVIAYSADGKVLAENDSFRICAGCATVSGLSATVSGENELTVSWNSSACHGYYIQWSTSSTFNNSVQGAWISGSATNTYKISTNTGANEYYVRVRSWKTFQGGTVYGDFSSPAAAKGLLPPSGFAVTGRGEGGKALWLDWNDVQGADGYEIYDVTNGANTLKGITDESRFTFTDFSPAWEYDIKVVATCKNGMQSQATYRVCAACAPVEGFEASVSGANEISASWNYAVCHGYYIQWSTDPEFKNDVHGEWINSTFTENYTITTSSSAKNYYVRIRCWKYYEDGMIFSDFTSAQKAGGLLPPSGFAVTGRGEGGKALWLDWEDVDGAVKYMVYDVTNGANTFKGEVTKSNTEFHDFNPAWEYDIKVVAIDAGGKSASATYRVCAACAPVEGFTAAATDDNTISASWNYAVCHGYYIQWSTDPEFKNDVHGEWINSTFTENCTITTSSNANDYYVRIRCWKYYQDGMIFSDFTNAQKATELIPASSFAVTGRGDGGKALWLDWADATDAASYQIIDVTNGAYTIAGTSQTSNFTFTNLNPSWEYDVVVIGLDKNGNNCATSKPYRFCAACPPVENFKAIITGDNTIKATWSYAVCHGYYIQWSTDPEFKNDVHGEWINNTFAESFTITTDGAAEHYYVRIRSWKNYNDGKIFSDFCAPVLPE